MCSLLGVSICLRHLCYVTNVYTQSFPFLQAVQHVTEYHFNVNVSWSISVYSGNAVDDRHLIKSRTSSSNLITQSKDIPADKTLPPCDLSLTWLLEQIDTTELTSHFKIDTEDTETITPRRNQAIDKALDFSRKLGRWSNAVGTILNQSIAGDLLKWHNPALPQALFSIDKLTSIHKENPIFNPVLPLMENLNSSQGEKPSRNDKVTRNHSTLTFKHSNNDTKTLLSTCDLYKLLNEHVRTLNIAMDSLSKTCPGEQSLSAMSCSEFGLLLLLRHVDVDLSKNFADSVNYVESMLETQLISAVGKRLTNNDFYAFIRYHNGIVSPAPKPFSHAIRCRPEKTPVGLLSIESESKESIYSHSRVVNVDSVLCIPLNAATSLALEGDQILHGWMNYRFGPRRDRHNLVARARQFSSFILVIGTMTSQSTLEPKDAIIVQNKDEVLIPLVLNELPTAKEFKDAIKSLSTKQQQFARAFRSMQLASSVFGVCVVQVKPQLEMLLGLPPNALDKEMQLTQDLMELFVEYQVPSDLLSYSGVTGNVANEDKVSNVKQNVKSVIDVIDGEKEKEMKIAEHQTNMAIEQRLQREQDSISCSVDPARMPAHAPSPTRQAFGSARRLKSAAAAAPEMTSAHSPRFTSTENFVSSQPSSSNHLSEALESNLNTAVTRTTEESIGVGNQQGLLDQSASIDFTLVPKILDVAIEKSGDGPSLRSTVVKASDNWVRSRQENILSRSKTQNLNSTDIKNEKNKAFDLLDGLSRSGSLPIKFSELHVVVAATHCFEKDVIDTVVCDNVDPIEKIEMSTLLFASTVHGVPARDLVRDGEELRRLEGSVPLLLQEAL